MKRTAFAVMTSIFLMCGLIFGETSRVEAAAQSATWSLRYAATGGPSLISEEMEIYTCGSGYVATCTPNWGDCIYRVVEISAYYVDDSTGVEKNVSFDRSVRFSTTGSITFATTTAPNSNSVTFRADLIYENGNSAFSNGTLEMNVN